MELKGRGSCLRTPIVFGGEGGAQGGRRPSRFSATALAPSAALLATLAPQLDLCRKMAGTGKQGARFPVSSATHPSARPPAGRCASRPGRTAGPTRQDKERGTRAPVGPRRWPLKGKTNGEWGLRQPGQRGLQRLGSTRGKREEGPASRAPRYPGSPGRPAHPEPRLTPAARSWAGAGRCKRTGGRLGTQIPGALLARRSPWRPRSSRAGSGRPAPSSRAQDEACLLWASCGVESRLTPLQALADSPPPVPRDPPPPSRPLPYAISMRPLLSASRLLWQAGRDCTSRPQRRNALHQSRCWCRHVVPGRALLLAWNAHPGKAFQRETKFTPSLRLA